MLGLSDKSELQEKIIKVDENTAMKYVVSKETINLEALRNEKKMLEDELKFPEPSKEELIEMGKSMHPYYMRNIDMIKNRIEEINILLEIK